MISPPPPFTGVMWRPAALGDIPGIVALAAAVDEAEHLDFAGGPEFWSWWLKQHDLAADTMAAVDEAGVVLALGGSYPTDTDVGARAILWMDAHPDRLDLEAPLLAWVTARGREQVSEAAHHHKIVRIGVEEHRGRRRQLVEDAGFTAARSFVDMTRPLDDLPGTSPLPEGVTIAPWTPDLDEPARLSSNAAFADHWGSLPIDRDTWTTMVMDDVVRRDCSFVAIAGGEVVAICLTEVDPEDDPNNLWVQRVGTRPEWQRRGLASALLVEALRAGKAAGLSSSALGVDEESRFDATALYGRLGYRIGKRSIAYVLETP